MHNMARPKKRRMVHFEHNIRHFKPSGICLNELDEINITIDELESLRLSYIENMKQDDAAEKMHVHQSTYQRTLQRTLQKIADALVNGKSIRVEGGDYIMTEKDRTEPMGKRSGGRHNRRKEHKRRRFSESTENGFIESGQNCKCPDCGYEQPHTPGVPCGQIKCPKCGKTLIRK